MEDRTGGPAGIFAAALTPLNDDLSINHEALAAHCGRLAASGCHGLGVFGTTGEANSFSVAEREEALDALVENGVPGETLLPGIGSCALTDAVRLGRAALAAGAAGLLVLPPFYYKDVSDDGIFRFFAELIERIGDERLRLYLYHIPQMAGLGFSLPLIGRLVGAYSGVVVGTKDSSGDLERMRTTCREFPGFAVFAGTERYLLDTLRYGGAGCISATVNVTSRLAREVFDNHQAGRTEEAEALQKRLTDLRVEIEAQPLIPTLKGLMRELTGEREWLNVRPPLSTPAEDRTREVLSRLPTTALL